MQFLYRLSTEIIVCFSFQIFVSSFHLVFIPFLLTYLRKLKLNSEKIDVQVSALFENSAQNPAVLSAARSAANQKRVVFLFVQ